MTTTESGKDTEAPSAGLSGPHLDRPTLDQRERLSARQWSHAYRNRLRVTDVLAVTVGVLSGIAIWGAVTSTEPGPHWNLRSAALIVLWMVGLSLEDTRSHRVTGAGASEFRRMWQASVVVLAIVAIAAVFFPSTWAEGAILAAMPLGFALLLIERAAWRGWLKAQRRKGGWSTRALLVGSEESVRKIRDELERAPDAGYRVVGVCVPSPDPSSVVADVRSALVTCGADTVIVTGTDGLSPERVKDISWSLEPGREHLMLAPNITDVAGPRVRTRPVSGLPLIHVETPRLGRQASVIKRSFDVVVSGALIVLLAPVLALLALAVKLTSPGPLLFRQQRVGYHAETFSMLKFRSMREGADLELEALLEEQGSAEEPLFKVDNDPRITSIGRFLRKYSLDELPQLFNVLGGSMSLVGPRPQVAAEVALYSRTARRRLLARPGITGLWQVSGRSSLAWEQAVRFDLYYVENWSLMYDLIILARTFKAVVAPGSTAH